jgi:Golgi SNAP receptor complex protein 2
LSDGRKLTDPASLGQISASLAAMHRTIEDYDSMAKREIIKAKQEKGQMCVTCIDGLQWSDLSSLCRRVQKFRADYAELKGQFELLKAEVRSAIFLEY